MYSNQVTSHFLYDFVHLSRSGKSELGLLDYGSIQGAPRSHSICCSKNHSFLLSRSVVGAEVNFDNSKDSGEGCAVNPSKSS